jgi:adenylate cyclase
MKLVSDEPTESSGFLGEIKRRKVVRVIFTYLIVGWLLIQIADVTIEPLRLPEWSSTLVIWLVSLGFPIAIVLAWVLDVTPSGIEVTAPAENSDAPSDASIAVLPFVNLSGDVNNEYFSDGLAEELLNLLARLQSLRVCSRTSSFALTGTTIDMPTIARQLNVRHVLEGSVRRSGDKVRITAQFIDAVDDRHLWSETYDRDLQDIFAVQDEISMHIVEALKLKLTSDEQQAMQSTTEDAKALDFYLRGREQFHRTETGHLEKAREMFEAAIHVDPNYALAWAGLTYVFVDTYWYQNKESKWIEQAHESSRKAIEFAPHLAESHAARGYAFYVHEQFAEAEAEFEKAIAINPRLFEPVHFYAQMARVLGQHEKAADLYSRAAELRPEDYQTLSLGALMFESFGATDRAQELYKEFIDRAERALELNPNDARAMVLSALVYLKLGDKETGLEMLQRAQDTNPDSPNIMYNSACFHALSGNPEISLDYLERAAHLGARNKRMWESDKDFENIKDHPRFRALLERI